MKARFERQKNAVIQVGSASGIGRGFVIAGRDYRFHRIIITAAHCLPRLPRPVASLLSIEVTYKNLVGPLDAKAPDVWAECLFVDPVADIAVLASPDAQEFYEQAEGYEAFTGGLPAMALSRVPDEGDAYLLMPDGSWSGCRIRQTDQGMILMRHAAKGIHGGMSGSPILDGKGKAIGLVSMSSGSNRENSEGDREGASPSLANHLPGWLLRELGVAPFRKNLRREREALKAARATFPIRKADS
jgi:hypothetical protein